MIAAASIPVTDISGWPRLLFHVATAVSLGGAVLAQSHRMIRALEWRPLAYIGTISYGVYLLHKFSMHVALKLGAEGLTYFAASLLGSIAIARLSYKYFEAPLLRLKHRFHRRTDQPDTPSAVPAS